MGYVPPEGSKNAKIALVGEAPGRDEERIGRPFVGKAGGELDRMLHSAKILRSECYITNVVKQRPPHNDFSIYYQTKNKSKPTPELLKWHQSLWQELQEVAPNVIVALGAEAFYALTGYRTVDKLRGYIFQSPYVESAPGIKAKVIPTYHPAAILRNYPNKVVGILDLKKALRHSAFPEYTPPKRDLKVYLCYNDVVEAHQRLMEAEYVSFDIETPYHLDQPQMRFVRCIAFSDASDWAICIPFTNGNWGYWSTWEEKRVLRMVQDILENPKSKKIAQNCMFDIYCLAKMHGIVPKNMYLDTMLGFHSVYVESAGDEMKIGSRKKRKAGLKKSLEFLTSIYTDEPYYKSDLSSSRAKRDDMEEWIYNAKDAAVTYEVGMKILDDIKASGVETTFKTAMSMVSPVLFCALKGLKVNLPQRKLLHEKYHKRIAFLEDKLKALTYPGFNPKSPKQLSDLLYTKLKLPTQVNRKTKKASVDAEALKNLERVSNNPILKILLLHRKDTKLFGTYLNPTLDNGRICCLYNIAGTTSGRLASTATPFGYGTNLQNIPKGELRQLIIPDDGKVFIEVDLSGAEGWVVAYESQDFVMQKAVKEGRYHETTASEIFGVPIEQVQKDQRQIGKKVNHASNYGMGPLTFAAQLSTPTKKVKKAEAQSLLDAYHRIYKRIKPWHQEIEKELIRTKTLVTPFGRKRMFFDRINDATLRSAFSFIPQSTVVHVINTAWVKLMSYYPLLEVVAQVHDSLLIQCLEKDVAEVVACINKEIAIPITSSHGITYTIPWDFKSGKDWGNMESMEEANEQVAKILAE